MSIVGNTTMGDNVGGLDGNSGKHKVSETRCGQNCLIIDILLSIDSINGPLKLFKI